MLGDGALCFHEYAVREPLPLARIQRAILEFLIHRDDVVLFGAQAVNAYVETPRMTQDVDLLSARAQPLTDELRRHLADLFTIAMRVREVKGGRGYRLYQVRKPRNRHIADIRSVEELPPHQTIEGIRVLTPVELICWKAISLASRRQTAKGDTDSADLRRLLAAFPELKCEEGDVDSRLESIGNPQARAAWRELVTQPVPVHDEDDEF